MWKKDIICRFALLMLLNFLCKNYVLHLNLTLLCSVKSVNESIAIIPLSNTTIKTTSVCDGDARSVGGGRGWLAGDTDGLAGDGGRSRPASLQ